MELVPSGVQAVAAGRQRGAQFGKRRLQPSFRFRRLYGANEVHLMVVALAADAEEGSQLAGADAVDLA